MFIDSILKEKFSTLNEIAVVDKERELSYSSLIGQYSQVGAFLAESAICQGNFGAIVFIDKSIEALISILGTLNAGGYYIPVDITLPKAKLNYIIEESRPSVVIVTPATFEIFKLYNLTANIVVIDYLNDSLNLKLLQSKKEVFEVSVTSKRTVKDIAYVIFTSGSTGKPKAVMISHENLLAFLDSVESINLITDSIRYMAVSPWFFDASILDIYFTLVNKGTLFLMNEISSPTSIPKFIEKYSISHTLLVSSVLKVFGSKFAGLEHFNLTSLKLLWYGGESCNVSYLHEIKKKIPGVSFVHGYGPTELTHTSTFLFFNEIPHTDTAVLPIGKPLKNIDFFIISEDGQEIKEPFKIGELYLGGKQLMLGYLNDSINTERVITEYPLNSGNLMYKSGDFVFLNLEGDIVFNGRKDDLVKHNGYLISLVEIENKANELESVKDSIVFHSIYDWGSKLTLVVIFSKNLELKQVKEFLVKNIPKYMIPDEIKVLDERDVPITRNGKLDKTQLRKNLNLN